MQRYKFPLLLPPDLAPLITQGFGATENTLEPAGPHGEPHFHFGVDVVDGDALHTYGTPIVCPFPSATLTAYEQPPTTGAATPFIKLAATGASGTHYSAVFAHVSAIFFRESYKEGDIIGLVGNYGLVAPKPTPATPFAGSHLHLGLQADGVWVNPLDYFNIADYYIGAAHDPESNIPRLSWALDELRAQFAALTQIKSQ